jgi:hypothetical protein
VENESEFFENRPDPDFVENMREWFKKCNQATIME